MSSPTTAPLRTPRPRPNANPDPFGWIGHELGGATITRVAARGGFSVVYRARHNVFGEDVAIKCLHLLPRLSDHERQRFIRLFLTEGRAMYRLTRRTSSIVQPLNMGAAVSPSGTWTPWLMLEWLEGRTLAREIAHRARHNLAPLTLRATVELLAPIAEALAEAHAAGIIHRDVAPQNIFLWLRGSKPSSKLLDFGVAKVVEQAGAGFVTTSHTPRLITKRYAAPEQLSSAFGDVTPATDVYALALVIVDCIAPPTTTPPSTTDSAAAEDAAVIDRAIDPVTRPTPRMRGVDIPNAAEHVFARALAVDARMRFPDTHSFFTALRQALEPSR